MLELEEFKYEKPISLSDIVDKDGFYITASLPGLLAATATNYGIFFTPYAPFQIVWVAESHTTAGTDAGAVTLNLEKLTGATALDSGDLILNTAFDLKGTADTVVSYEGNQLTKNRQLIEGDRLALKDVGTLTNLAGVCVVVYYKYLGQGHYA